MNWFKQLAKEAVGGVRTAQAAYQQYIPQPVRRLIRNYTPVGIVVNAVEKGVGKYIPDTIQPGQYSGQQIRSYFSGARSASPSTGVVDNNTTNDNGGYDNGGYDNGGGGTSGGGGGTSGGGGGAVSTWTPKVFNGVLYTSEPDYYNAQLNYLDQQYGNQLNTLNTNKTNQLGTYDTQKTNFLQQIADNLDTLNTQQKNTLGDIGVYYSNLGQGYQSSQGVRENQTNTEATKAQGKLDTSKTQGLDSLSKAVQQYLDSYNQSTNSLAQQYQSAKDTLVNQPLGEYANVLTAQGVVPTAANLGFDTQGLTSNQGLMAVLNALRSNPSSKIYGGSQNSQFNANPILQYLNAIG